MNRTRLPVSPPGNYEVSYEDADSSYARDLDPRWLAVRPGEKAIIESSVTRWAGPVRGTLPRPPAEPEENAAPQ
jgi:hypothetical protein